MRQFICGIILAALCLLPTLAQAADGAKTYANRYGGYSLAYPSGWKVEDGDRDHSVHITDKNGESVNVKIFTNYFDKTKTVETLSQSEISDLTLRIVQDMHAYQPDGMQNFTVDDFGTTPVGAQKAMFVATTAEWADTGKSRESKYILYCLLHKGDLYVLITEANPATASSFRSTFQQSIDSFKFLF